MRRLRGERRRGEIPYFNPRTHVGCDFSQRLADIGVPYFNPRTHVGCDPGKDPERPRLRISIHAPTWGATLVMLVGDTPEAFQSTHPRGVRHNNTKSYEDTLQFQSTHPRGVRHVLNHFLHIATLFQSTHPRGVRLAISFLKNKKRDISIHAPTWGATESCRGHFQDFRNFNPRTHVGCDSPNSPNGSGGANFNPRTHVGCDAASVSLRPVVRNFNPRTHVGCDILCANIIHTR